MNAASKTTVSNWAGTHHTQPVRVYHPQDEPEVQAIIRVAGQAGLSVRAVGAKHSPGDLFCVPHGKGVLIETDHLNRVLELNSDDLTVTVEAGMRLRTLNECLSSKGLALSVLPDYEEAAIAGLISGGSHGYGYQHGCLSTLVDELTLVLANGELVTCSREKDSQLFQASRLGLGLTGVITRVKLRCVRAFNLERTQTALKFSEFVGNMEGQLCGAEYVAASWWPAEDIVVVASSNSTVKTVSAPKSRMNQYFWNELVFYHFLQLVVLLAHALGSALTARFWHFLFIHTAPLEGPSSHVGSSVAMLTADNRIKQRTCEGSVPIEKAAACLSDIKQWLDAERRIRGTPLRNLPIGIRVVEEDDIWLSPTCSGRGVYLCVTETLPYGQDIVYHRDLYSGFEAILKRHSARPNWAKEHWYTSQELHALYPRMQDFLSVRKEVDPDGLFVNPYAQRHLGV